MTNLEGRSALGGLWNSIQSWLLPMLEDEIRELDEKHRQFVAVWDFPSTRDLIDAVRHRPTLRRLWGEWGQVFDTLTRTLNQIIKDLTPIGPMSQGRSWTQLR